MRINKFILPLLLIGCIVSAQVNSVSFFGEYSLPISKKLAVTDISGVGGGINLKLDLTGNFKINIAASYSLFSLSQDSAITQWDWRFWSRYSDFVNQTLSSPIYKADLGPVQKMDLIPLYLTVEYEFLPFKKIRISPFAGGGIYFFTRRLYINENWTKEFEDAGYVFDYNFRNFAPDKSGNPFFITTGISLAYILTDTFHISSNVKYVSLISTKGKFGYDVFPFEDSFDINIGINLLY